jgi:hypothetical protein
MNAALIKVGGIGIALALALVLVGYFAADAMSGPLLVTPPGGDSVAEVTIGQALMFTVLGGGVGIGLALGAQRLGRPQASFVAVCVVALVLYGIMPFAAAEETSTAIWLNILHLAAAVPIVGSLARQLPAERA